MKRKEKISPRVERTRGYIQEALLALMRKKDYMDITVTDICSAAGVSRGTFYAHYKNTQQVVEDLFDEAIIHIGNVPLQYIFNPENNGTCDGALCCFLRENKKYQPLFFTDSLYTQAVQHVVDALTEDFLQNMKPRSQLPDEMLINLLYYQISGCMAVCKRHIHVSDESWSEIQKSVDAFLCKGFQNI